MGMSFGKPWQDDGRECKWYYLSSKRRVLWVDGRDTPVIMKKVGKEWVLE